MKCRPFNKYGPLAVMPMLLSTGCGGSTESGSQQDVVQYSADYPVYHTSEEIIDSADLIVRGTVVDSRVAQLAADISTDGDQATNPQAGLSEEEAARVPSVVVTIFSVRVTDVLKGELGASDLVEVSQLGGELDDVSYEDAGTVHLSRAEESEYVLLLDDHGSEAPFDLLNPQQAAYTLADNGILQSLSPAGDPQPVTTLEELRSQID